MKGLPFSTTALREALRQSIARSSIFLQLRSALRGSHLTPQSNSRVGRKLQKLRRHPEEFFRDSQSTLIRRTGLPLYRVLSLSDATPLEDCDLPHRSIVVWLDRYSPPIARWWQELGSSIGSGTELVLLAEKPIAASLVEHLEPPPCSRFRCYLYAPDLDASSILEYGIARSYAGQVVLARNPSQQDLARVSNCFRQLRTAGSHVTIPGSQMLALHRSEHARHTENGGNSSLARALADFEMGLTSARHHRPLPSKGEPEPCMDLPGYYTYAAIAPCSPFAARQPRSAAVLCWERSPAVCALPASTQLPSVSVIMTVYNAATSVEQAIECILRQSHKALELIIIDDCSTDECQRILSDRAVSDPRIKLLKTPRNSGTYYAKNMGLAVATGEYVTFQDADDISSAHRIELQLRALLSDPECIANQVRCQRLSPDGTERWLDGTSNRAAPITLMFRKDEILQTIGYFDSVRIAADAEFMLRMQAATGRQPVVLPCVCYYALHAAGSLTTSGPGAFTRTGDGRRVMPSARTEYRVAAKAWHREILAGRTSRRMDFPLENRPFPAPREILP